MGNRLPLELLSEIAAYLKEAHESLAQYTTVCREWQAAFEPHIYRQTCVHSDDLQGQSILSLSKFHIITSGTVIGRLSMIQELEYRIILPYQLDDYCASITEDKAYRKENPIRHVNDEAFRRGITELFTTLASWSDTHRLSLVLAALGRQKELEPGTREHADAGTFRGLHRGDEWAVRPYRAQFPDGSASALPVVSCVDKLCFPNAGLDPWHMIWSGTALQIAQRCPTLTWLHLGLDEYARPDHLDYIRDRRQAVAEELCNLPASLRVFHYFNQLEKPWQNTLPALNVLSDKIDTFPLHVQSLSLHLRELKMPHVAITSDFFWPLDKQGKPTGCGASLHWPYLEIIGFDEIPDCLPSGEWLFDPDDCKKTEVPNLEAPDWEDIRLIEESPYDRTLMNFEHFHRVFIAMGYAAQHMPLLKTIRLLVLADGQSTFDFSTDQVSGRRTVTWASATGYKPDERVAQAWGFNPDDIDFIDHWEGRDVETNVTFHSWPPEDRTDKS
ncbi:F-box protein [Aspergillus udagawae]|uniref:F-box domain-containing protein n=1 Tax=Aspergillus udagawae TaxID=91492 RepID=A0A8E0QQA5_9EURO|nr:uncharacterized protein Aud_003507 [Aspergillus udagawae]GIC87126.1 hypothetical protein Aud_003507 [Aspergillus udagawae]